MENSVKKSEDRLKQAFKSTKYALKGNKEKLNTKQTHEDDYGEEYDLDISQIASLPNIEQIRRY